MEHPASNIWGHDAGRPPPDAHFDFDLEMGVATSPEGQVLTALMYVWKLSRSSSQRPSCRRRASWICPCVS
eukprot:4186603-Pyramimonas_sp.AAC.1